jgi:hypothetical protein
MSKVLHFAVGVKGEGTRCCSAASVETCRRTFAQLPAEHGISDGADMALETRGYFGVDGVDDEDRGADGSEEHAGVVGGGQEGWRRGKLGNDDEFYVVHRCERQSRRQAALEDGTAACSSRVSV